MKSISLHHISPLTSRPKKLDFGFSDSNKEQINNVIKIVHDNNLESANICISGFDVLLIDSNNNVQEVKFANVDVYPTLLIIHLALGWGFSIDFKYLDYEGFGNIENNIKNDLV